MKLDPGGKLAYSTLLGGSAADQGDALALGREGTVYIGGTSWSSLQYGAVRNGPGGEADGWVSAVRPGNLAFGQC